MRFKCSRKWQQALFLSRNADVQLDVIAYGAAISACIQQWQAELQLN